VHKKGDKRLDRVLDANFNRAKEGLRVCEDVCRFVLDARGLTRSYKTVRHQLSQAVAQDGIPDVILARGIERDVGRTSTDVELKRRNVMDIFYANSQRVKESVRVLEEFTKLRDKKAAEQLKRIRYRVYALEKNVIERR